MFKVFINDGSSEMPEDDIFYIIAKGGIYLKKKVGIMESIAPVDKISVLNDVEPNASLNIRKIPSEKIAKVVEFFKEIYELHKSEAVVLLHYNQQKKRYILQVPPQEVAYAGIDYVKNITYKGYDLIGSIHSHANFSAFHSGIDHIDEKHFDGLHITIGDVADDFLSFSSSIMSNGVRFTVSPGEYAEGIQLVEYTPYWASMFKPSFEIVKGVKSYKKYVKTKLGYTVIASEEEKIFPRKWLNYVVKKSYSYLVVHNIHDTSIYLTNKQKAKKRQAQIGYTGTFKSTKDEDKDKGKVVKVGSAQKDEFNPCGECVFRDHKLNLNLEKEFDSLVDNYIPNSDIEDWYSQV